MAERPGHELESQGVAKVANLLQVNELTMQNEYQLRLKDLAMNEKVKELTEKFTAELDVDKTKFDTLLQEKNEQELDYEEKMKQYEEKHQAQSGKSAAGQ